MAQENLGFQRSELEWKSFLRTERAEDEPDIDPARVQRRHLLGRVSIVQVEMHVGISRAELSDAARQIGPVRPGHPADRQAAGLASFRAPRLRHRIVGVRDDRLRLAEKSSPRLREIDAALGAPKQHGPELVFELTNLLA